MSEQALSETNLRRLRRLQSMHEELFTLRQPLTAALVVALSRPADEIMSRSPEFEPEEDISAIQAVAEAQVRKAMKGDAAAFAQIADRVEGRVGTRKGDTDDDADRHRVTVEATIEGVVEAMTRRRIEPAPQLEAPVDPQPVVLEHDNNRQDVPQSGGDNGSSR